MELDVAQAVLLRPADGEGETVVDQPRRTLRILPGTFVAAPPGAEHWFRIPDGGEPISLLNIHAPDTGFTDRLRRSA